jgi:excisionase family DNA binding protein
MSVSASGVPGAVLTTGQAARLCAVDPKTIARWADAGHLRSHRTAGGRRRMLACDIRAFMRDHGMPSVGDDPAQRVRIAVVDDDPRVVKVLMRALARIVPGADCESARDGFSAGALVTSFQPDLVFLDIVMPGISGIEVCEHIRSTPGLAATAVVIVSGNLSDKLRTRLTASGANRFISKPFSANDIASAVTDLLPAAATRTVRKTAALR